MKNKEALELALMMLERDNLKVANIYVNYDIQKALIKLVKKKLEKKSKKKEWVGLTDDEIHKIEQECDQKFEDYFEFANAIEAKLKEKNT
jgi:fructose/tagatose bisphosphate aldolase